MTSGFSKIAAHHSIYILIVNDPLSGQLDPTKILYRIVHSTRGHLPPNCILFHPLKLGSKVISVAYFVK